MDEREIFLQGKHVLLKVLTENDILNSGWYGWFNNGFLCRYNQHHYFPNTIEQQRTFLESTRQTGNAIRLGIVDRRNTDAICGVVSLQSIDHHHQRAEIACFTDERILGAVPNVTLEAWSLMLRHGFESLNLVKVSGGSFHPDIPTALQRLFGFEIEGCLRRHVYKEGQLRDITLVAVFKDTIRYPEFD